ncbi:MAG TPA: glycosyltransferase [Candidatus Magasanikbacteria bacterium]|nr:glycosyltransferase [Candidatus Magasanikbacteria bacterium]
MSAGAGHKRAAEALFLSCQKEYPDINCCHLDVLDYSTKFLNFNTAGGYHFLVKYLPFIYRLAYNLTDSPKTAILMEKLSGLFALNSPKLQEFIKNYSPDLIIATHFLIPAMIKKNFPDLPIDMIITDYGLHGFWLNLKIRNFYVATHEISDKLRSQGIYAFVTGLPINPGFVEEKNLESLKIKYNINPNIPTILIMSGGFGLKNQKFLIKKVLKSFPDFNLLVIAGKNNKKMIKKYLALKKETNPHYQVFEFIEKIEDLMAVSDIIITKPGGITLTECAYLNKKIILNSPIPGQEEINKNYFIKHGLAFDLNKKNIVWQIENLLKQKEILSFLPKNSNEQILQQILKNSR